MFLWLKKVKKENSFLTYRYYLASYDVKAKKLNVVVHNWEYREKGKDDEEAGIDPIELFASDEY